MLALLLPAALAGDLVVTLSGETAPPGTVRCALFASAEGFPGEPQRAIATAEALAGPAPTCRFPDLAPGRYAVSVVHDRNENLGMDTNLVGIPQEPWGVSRGARPGLRAPRFDEAAVDVPATGLSLDVRLE
jgi:uncharacterized protein (DUF2141 family)